MASRKKSIATQKEANTQKEARIKEARKALTDGTISKITHAAHQFELPYDTLRRRHLGLTVAPSVAHINQQLLTEAEELTVCKWVKYMGMTGHPISKEMLRGKVTDISSVL